MLKYFIDGAHTIESIEQFVTWFKQLNSKQSENEKNVLLFNYTGERNPSNFLKELMVKLEFFILENLENINL